MSGETLKDSRNIGTAEVRPEVIIKFGDFAFSFIFLNS
jgi:hypothetical protein